MLPTPDASRPQPSHATDVPGRRRFLRGSLVAGAVLLSPTAARAVTQTAAKTTKTIRKSTRTTKTTKTAKTTSTTTKATTTTAAAATGAAFDPSNELAVAFTFATTDGGFRVHNPYVAVFIEDAAGMLVRTIDLSIEATGRGLRYINELRHWYRVADGGSDLVETMSGATRIPGTYNVVWDGRNEAKVLVPSGEYYVCIEASRERGPYELIREQVTIGHAPFTKKLADSGELQGASVELRTRV